MTQRIFNKLKKRNQPSSPKKIEKMFKSHDPEITSKTYLERSDLKKRQYSFGPYDNRKPQTVQSIIN